MKYYMTVKIIQYKNVLVSAENENEAFELISEESLESIEEYEQDFIRQVGVDTSEGGYVGEVLFIDKSDMKKYYDFQI